MKKALPAMGFLGVLLVALFVGVRWSMATTPLWSMGLGFVGVLLLSAYLWMDRKEGAVQRSQKAIQAKAVALFLIAVAAVLVILLNAFVGRNEVRFDATRSGKHTLSSFSRAMVSSLEVPVDIVGLFPRGSKEEQAFVDLYQRFADESSSLSLQLIDALESPMEFKRLQTWVDLETLGNLQVLFLIRSQDGQAERTFLLDGPITEEDFVLALNRVQVEKRSLVCFTQGHGERDLGERYNLVDYGGIHERMLAANFEVGTIQPMGAVPDACDVVVVAGPTTELHAVTQENLALHVRSGGALVVLLEPVMPGDEPSVPMDLERYGFAIGQDLVLETHPDRVLKDRDNSYVVVDVESFDAHPVVRGLKRATLFQGARSIGLGRKIPGIYVQALARTTPLGWAERDEDSIRGDVLAQHDSDEESAVPLMAVAEILDPQAIEIGPLSLVQEDDFSVRVLQDGEIPPGKKTRAGKRKPMGKVVVFGDSDFISNWLVLSNVNHDLFLNVLSWLVDEEAPLGQRSHDRRDGLMILSGKESQEMWRFVLFFAPALSLCLAVVVWWFRRDARVAGKKERGAKKA